MTSEREDLLEKLDSLSDQADLDEVKSDLARIRSDARKAYRTHQKGLRSLEEKKEIIEGEISDADEFIRHLQMTLDDFDAAKLTYSAFGMLAFKFCPSCYAPVEPSGDDVCGLCKRDRTVSEDDSRALAVRLDLEMQLKESESLQLSRREELAAIGSGIRRQRAALRKALATLEEAGPEDASSREVAVADISRKVGFFDSQLEHLQARLEIAEKINRSRVVKEDLEFRVKALEEEISAISRSQETRKRFAYSRISKASEKILKDDLQEHNDFGAIDYIGFSFADDWVAVNGDKNRARSASGMVILKNSFAAGMFDASLNDLEFNLPRWMLFDNIEDKGMVEERAQNFQRLLVSMSESAEIDHQLIFTTSKIAPELAESKYVVGGKYTKDRKSLNE